VLAHGIGGREDLPLPLGWVVGGAAAAVIVSFLAVGVLWHEPRLNGATAGRPAPLGLARVVDSRGLRLILAGAGLLFTGYFLLALIFGKDDANNPAPWVVYVLLWVGLVPASVLLGPVWRFLSPLRTLHAGLNRVQRLDPKEGVRPFPPTLGWWPAAVGLFAFTWLELVAPDPVSLTTLRLAVGLYTAVQVLAALYFGSAWFDRGEAFEAWSTLFGRLAVVGRREDGALVVRNPLAGLDALAPAPGLVAAVGVMLGSTAYDGVAGSTAWLAFAQSSPLPRVVVDTAGMITVITGIVGLYLACTAAAGVLGRCGATGIPTAFAHSVVPIALGYVVAHYYSFFVLQAQQALIRLTDPLGIGADWLGTSDLTLHSALVGPTLVANLQVAAIILGHVFGVVLAHDRAVRLFPRRVAVTGQIPLLVLMVALTCFGLLLLFSS
jgi:hypothetical protein